MYNCRAGLAEAAKPLNEDSLMFPIAAFTYRGDRRERDWERWRPSENDESERNESARRQKINGSLTRDLSSGSLGVNMPVRPIFKTRTSRT